MHRRKCPGGEVQYVTVEVDVSKQIKAKAAALCAYRSQFGLELELFPEIPLQEIFRREYFMHAPPARVVETDLSEPHCPTRPTSGRRAPRKERNHCGRDAKREH
jgi:hypothetical protein